MKTIKTLLLGAALAALASNASAQSWLTNGLVAYYPFNANANDESGNGFNGTVNGATLTTDRFGRTQSCYSFNGTDNYIRLPLNTGNLNGSTQVTISAWINPNQIKTGSIFSHWANYYVSPPTPDGIMFDIYYD